MISTYEGSGIVMVESLVSTEGPGVLETARRPLCNGGSGRTGQGQALQGRRKD